MNRTVIRVALGLAAGVLIIAVGNLLPALAQNAAPPATLPAPAARLDFRIAAEIGQDDKLADNLLPRKVAEELIRQLNEKGPRGKYDRPDGFDWFETTDDEAVAHVRGVYETRHYILLMKSEPYTMLAERDGRRTWGLKRVYLSKNGREQLDIGFEFDAAGAERFGKLTEMNLHRSLAVLIDDKVISIPSLNTKISGSGIIEGGSNGFDPATIKRIVLSLRQGIPPVYSSPATTQPATSRPAIP